MDTARNDWVSMLSAILNFNATISPGDAVNPEPFAVNDDAVTAPDDIVTDVLESATDKEFVVIAPVAFI
jgi:hypothetical protein